jgi:hypothetical protein
VVPGTYKLCTMHPRRVFEDVCSGPSQETGAAQSFVVAGLTGKQEAFVFELN